MHVTICGTDIDDDTVERVQTSQHFTGAGDYNRFSDFTFTTVPHTGVRSDGGRGTVLYYTEEAGNAALYDAMTRLV